jgi:Spy/CpxP family protein refolding chaperone
MKMKFVVAGAAMLVLGGAGYAIVSSFMAPAVWARETMRDGAMMCEGFGPGGLAEQLHLTQSQRAQVKSIVAAEKPQIAPLAQELGSTFKKVQAMTDTGTADPDQVRALINQEQPTLANLIVEGVKTKTTIYNTVLTPTQQKQAQQMLTDIGPRIEQHIDKFPTMTDRFVSMAAWRLDLSDNQQSQIRSLIQAGVQKDLPLVKQLAQDRDAMLNVTGGGRFDETEVRKVADSAATTATELAGDAVVLKTQVFAVLTPEQRARAVEFHNKMHAHHGGHFAQWHEM